MPSMRPRVWSTWGSEVTKDLIPMLGHAIDSRVLERIIERMRSWAHSDIDHRQSM
jgi:hypothetical protein